MTYFLLSLPVLETNDSPITLLKGYRSVLSTAQRHRTFVNTVYCKFSYYFVLLFELNQSPM